MQVELMRLQQRELQRKQEQARLAAGATPAHTRGNVMHDFELETLTLSLSTPPQTSILLSTPPQTSISTTSPRTPDAKRIRITSPRSGECGECPPQSCGDLARARKAARSAWL